MKTFLMQFGVFLALHTAFSSRAATTSWQGPGDGLWQDASKWSAGIPGVGASDVSMDGAAPAVVRVGAGAPDAALTVGRITLGGGGSGDQTLIIDGLGGRVFRMEDSLNVGRAGRFEVGEAQVVFDGTASGGGLHLNEGSIHQAGGSLQVVGAVARLGRVGTGVATQSGGTFTSDGDVLVGDLAGSSGTWVLKGGTTRVQGILYVADDAGSAGRIRVEGGDLAVSGPTLRVGDDGNGFLELVRGSVQADHVSVGRGPGGSGEVQMTGGRLLAGDFSIGRFAGARGVMTVQGGVMEVPADTLYVGRDGAGELQVRGGEVRVMEMRVAATAGATGVLDLSGGVLSVSQLLADQGGAQIRVTGGTLELGSSVIRLSAPLVIGAGGAPAVLRLTGGTNVIESGLVIEAGARLEGSGVILGNLVVRGIDARTGGGSGSTGTDVPARPSLTLSAGPTGWVVHVPTVQGWTYLLEDAVEGGWGSWRALGTAVPGTGALMALPVPGTLPSRALRVRMDRQ